MPRVLTEQTTALFYQGFTITGGALYFACIDCNSTSDVGVNIISVDAHDSRENGTQPPTTLFSFTDLDPTRQHVLTVVNLEDDRFNNTSQITFESVIVQIDASDDGNSTTSSAPATIIHGVPTVVVTATDTATTSVITTATTTDTLTQPARASSSGDATVGASPTQSPGVSTLATVGNSVAQTGTGVTNPSPSASAGSGGSTSGVTAKPTGSGATQASGGTPTSTQPANSSQTSQAGGGSSTSPVGGTSSPGNGGSASSSGGAHGSQPSASAIFSSTPNASGTAGASNNGQPSTTGVSKPVIISIAVVASLLVLGLLGAVLFMLLRNQAARRAASMDAEGAAGLMREAAPAAMVSGPVGLAPMRPQNPFADIVPPNVPLDASRSVESLEEPEDSVASEYSMPIEVPRPPPPAIPPKSPLRGAFNKSSPWLNRIPRNSSPTTPS
ncbi:hypothetical protein GY45DRAFT_569813 [Cubamyces sp. BRFM 1775]|nr:hypothetical protein GY45DRAFT_569813 [Cubamyces sp. BRFM 1775]